MEQVEAATGAAVPVRMYFTLLVVLGSFFAMSLLTAAISAKVRQTSIIERKTRTSASEELNKWFFAKLNRRPWQGPKP
jgi:hypothetical protein